VNVGRTVAVGVGLFIQIQVLASTLCPWRS
jgi:hypothetical protein